MRLEGLQAALRARRQAQGDVEPLPQTGATRRPDQAQIAAHVEYTPVDGIQAGEVASQGVDTNGNGISHSSTSSALIRITNYRKAR